jgi:hypothetical protein
MWAAYMMQFGKHHTAHRAPAGEHHIAAGVESTLAARTVVLQPAALAGAAMTAPEASCFSAHRHHRMHHMGDS